MRTQVTDPAASPPTEPYQAKVLANRKITPEGASDEVFHLVLEVASAQVSLALDQSVWVQPPGRDENDRPFDLRAYSVIQTEQDGAGHSLNLTFSVLRLVYKDLFTGEVKRGTASNFLCDAKPGDLIPLRFQG
ncbi:MAG: hypothetical protein A2557_06845 [Candidatus Lambdaproteobacteria bacterium RIFOXYD2_FULL_56_26]|uniref:FAD-binding FR-type domain-containing protein n=1 Tax=Candidatus Lambdaproteobacteria bacterium RIFOXYD2_FULL_56_26 TaxID=1817773 RepID=A0A1F6H333_9PROT|nr:MAG: hypothetical protein A2557_06845 [Candidatus Lambdaproteobacteria bacterium RIFOXYD2_FULL_56_26]